MPPYQVPYPADPQSLWLNEALGSEGEEHADSLLGRIRADVCIIGGGYAGLWAAIELKKRQADLSIVVVEAEICGSGASGRNVGLFSSSWHDLRGLCTTYGETEGLRYAGAISSEGDTIAEWCDAHGVDANVRRGGIAYYGRSGDPGPVAMVAAAEQLGAPGRLELWDSRRCRDATGAAGIGSAAYSRDAATIQPALLARGLRRVAIEQGVEVYERSEAHAVERGGRMIVRAARGSVDCDHVVLAIGAWAAGWPGFRRRLANVCEVVVATEPIPDRIEALGWNSDVALVGGRQLIYGVRKTLDGRLVIGGGDFAALFGGRVGRNLTHNRRIALASADGLIRLFPELDGVRFTHAWGGAMDMTPTFAPFVTRSHHGKMTAVLGFSGHGLAAARLAGRSAASLALGVEDEWSTLCVVGEPIASTPPEPLRWLAVWLALRASVASDLARERGGRPRRLSQIVAAAPVLQRRLVRRTRR